MKPSSGRLSEVRPPPLTLEGAWHNMGRKGWGDPAAPWGAAGSRHSPSPRGTAVPPLQGPGAGAVGREGAAGYGSGEQEQNELAQTWPVMCMPRLRRAGSLRSSSTTSGGVSVMARSQTEPGGLGGPGAQPGEHRQRGASPATPPPPSSRGSLGRTATLPPKLADSMRAYGDWPPACPDTYDRRKGGADRREEEERAVRLGVVQAPWQPQLPTRRRRHWVRSSSLQSEPDHHTGTWGSQGELGVVAAGAISPAWVTPKTEEKKLRGVLKSASSKELPYEPKNTPKRTPKRVTYNEVVLVVEVVCDS